MQNCNEQQREANELEVRNRMLHKIASTNTQKQPKREETKTKSGGAMQHEVWSYYVITVYPSDQTQH